MGSKNQKSLGRLMFGVVIALCSFLVFSKIAYELFWNNLIEFDQTVAGWIIVWRSPRLTEVMRAITNFGSTGTIIGVLVVGTVVGLQYWRRFDVPLLNLGTAGAFLLSESLKRIFQRTRPPLPWLGPASGYSFPSGHSLVSLALYGTLAYLLFQNIKNRTWRIRITVLLILLPLLIGISRIYLGMHYPSDVLAGWVLAIGWGVIWVTGVEYLSQKTNGKGKPEDKVKRKPKPKSKVKGRQT
jgi:membrane-associated phospholipid phosphatase